MNNLGSALRAQKKLADAEPLYTLALATRRETLGDAHAATLSSCNNLAVLLSEMRKFDAALPLLLEAFAGYRAQLGLTHPSSVSLVTNLSQVLFVAQTDGQSADESRQRGVALTREVLDACAAAAAAADDGAAGQHARHAKLLAAHLVKLLKALGDQPAIEQLTAEYGLAA